MPVLCRAYFGMLTKIIVWRYFAAASAWSTIVKSKIIHSNKEKQELQIRHSPLVPCLTVAP